jgi:hypothetical protein
VGKHSGFVGVKTRVKTSLRAFKTEKFQVAIDFEKNKKELNIRFKEENLSMNHTVFY